MALTFFKIIGFLDILMSESIWTFAVGKYKDFEFIRKSVNLAPPPYYIVAMMPLP